MPKRWRCTAITHQHRVFVVEADSREEAEDKAMELLTMRAWVLKDEPDAEESELGCRELEEE